MNSQPFPDLPDHTGSLHIGKRMGLTAAPAEGGFNEKLAAQLEISQRLLAVEKLGTTEKRQVLQLIDAYIERGQLKRKIESRA